MMPNPSPLRRKQLFNAISVELASAYAKHGQVPWSRHEFYAILLEEVEELWDAIKKNRPVHEIESELTQVAAMCVRYYETST
jgi:NTP pyrophosphatase (non-canonical NTP hydrolase)